MFFNSKIIRNHSKNCKVQLKTTKTTFIFSKPVFTHKTTFLAQIFYIFRFSVSQTIFFQQKSEILSQKKDRNKCWKLLNKSDTHSKRRLSMERTCIMQRPLTEEILHLFPTLSHTLNIRFLGYLGFKMIGKFDFNTFVMRKFEKIDIGWGGRGRFGKLASWIWIGSDFYWKARKIMKFWRKSSLRRFSMWFLSIFIDFHRFPPENLRFFTLSEARAPKFSIRA